MTDTSQPDAVAILRDLRRRALAGEQLSSAEYRQVLESLRPERIALATAAMSQPKPARVPKPEPFDLQAQIEEDLKKLEESQTPTPENPQ